MRARLQKCLRFPNSFSFEALKHEGSHTDKETKFTEVFQYSVEFSDHCYLSNDFVFPALNLFAKYELDRP